LAIADCGLKDNYGTAEKGSKWLFQSAIRNPQSTMASPAVDSLASLQWE
jgi:hypothetical protein